MRTNQKTNLMLCFDDESTTSHSQSQNQNTILTCKQEQISHANQIFLPHSAQSVKSSASNKKVQFTDEMLNRFSNSKTNLEKKVNKLQSSHFTERNNSLTQSKFKGSDQNSSKAPQILKAQTHRIEMNKSNVKSTGASLHQNQNVEPQSDVPKIERNQAFYQFQKKQLSGLIQSIHQSIENYKEKLKLYGQQNGQQTLNKSLLRNHSSNQILSKRKPLSKYEKDESSSQSQNTSKIHPPNNENQGSVHQAKGQLSQYITQCNPNQKLNPHQKNDSLPQDFQLKCSGKKKVRKMQNQSMQYYMRKMQIYFSGVDTESKASLLYRDHFVSSYHSLAFCNLTGLPPLKALEGKKVVLGRKPTLYNKTVVLDLDETLVHCNENLDLGSDIVLPIEFPTGEIIKAAINIRPYTVQLLGQLTSLCEVIVFTASHQCYADKVLDYLDPGRRLVHHRLYREHCYMTPEGVHIKDLRILENRELRNVVLVDNAAYSFGFQVSNGVPIVPFYDDPEDTELYQLLDYLKGLLEEDDVREVNRRAFRMEELQEHETVEQAIETFFFAE